MHIITLHTKCLEFNFFKNLSIRVVRYIMLPLEQLFVAIYLQCSRNWMKIQFLKDHTKVDQMKTEQKAQNVKVVQINFVKAESQGALIFFCTKWRTLILH